MKTVTQAELAELHGVDVRTIRAWGKKGLPRAKNGRYNVRDSIAWRVAQLESQADDEFRRARARRTAAQAKRAELDAAEREGELIPVSVMSEQIDALCARLAGRIRALPARAPRLALLNARALRAVLASEIVPELLAELLTAAEELADEEEAAAGAPSRNGSG